MGQFFYYSSNFITTRIHKVQGTKAVYGGKIRFRQWPEREREPESERRESERREPESEQERQREEREQQFPWSGETLDCSAR